MRPVEIPPVATERGSRLGTVYTHPAFGTIVVSRPMGNIGILHGSDLRHSSCVKLTIHEAEITRGLSNDWHSTRRTIVEVELSEHQWAHFVSSAGNGEGTPCTLRVKPEEGYGLQQVPYIAREETKAETFAGEMESLLREQIAAASEQIDKLGALIESGKLGKTELRAVHAALRNSVGRLPSSAGFVMEQFSENMEAVTQAAKTEVEAFVNNVAHRTGIEALRNGAAPVLIERKPGGAS